MTRETKVGLIVASSFLCLVCVVVASKWNRGDGPTDPEEQTVKVAAVKPIQNGATADPKNDKGPSLPSLPARSQAGDEKKNDKPVGSDMLDFSRLPPLPKDDEASRKELEQAKARNQSEKDSAPIKINPPPMPGAPPSFPQIDDKTPLISPPPGTVTDVKITPADPIKKPEGTVGTIEFPVPKPSALEEKKTVVIAPPEQPKQGGGLEIPPPLTDLAKTKPDATPSIPPLTAKDTIPSFPSIGAPKSTDPGTSLVPGPKEETTTPPVTLRPPNPIARIGGDELPSTPLITPGGNKPLLPIVKDVNNDFYECRPGETSLALVSQRLYASDKYADALLAYNRRHNSAIKNGGVFLFDRPSLSIGQQVLHPPISILERDYGSLIRVGGTSSVPTIPSITSPVNIAAPTNPGAATTSAPVASGRKYEVQNPNGESILDIAERTLGDRGQWHRIWRINQQYQPQFRIPAGTKLDLPAN
ncbi:MAG: hypothetical protein EXR98_11065 [Gemmataceae bacterium]|nr:hypothetical protein [Gemmataceae bacterium]